MKTLRSLLRQAAAALVAASMLAPAPGFALAGPGGGKLAAPAASQAQESREDEVRQPEALLAQSGGCYAIAQSIAAQHGGQVHSATPAERGGQSVCVIVILVPPKAGQHGRRLDLVVPN